jgi:hypothetical protein
MLLITIIVLLALSVVVTMFTCLELIEKGLIKAGHYITPKRVFVTFRGGKIIVVINGIQHLLCANRLKADYNVRASQDHIRKYKQELVAFFKEIGLKSYVYVRGKSIDNVYTRLTFAPNGISPEMLMDLLKNAFNSPWGDVTFKVVRA